MTFTSDILIIGCGIAGATAALRLAEDRRRQITVITRARTLAESNTRYAQGGIVTLGPEDSADLLVEDILQAGAGRSLPSAVRLLAEMGPDLVQTLLIDELSVPFDRDPSGELAYVREGGHTVPRVIHVGDATGRAIEGALVERLSALPNVTTCASSTAVELITSHRHLQDPFAVYRPLTCYGAYVLERETGTIHRYLAPTTVLATGGACQIYLYSSNPKGARGDGVAMAHRAGARIINAEYVQFHPTTLAVEGGYNFLISEAVRGEGGRLYTPDGRHFMDAYAPRWGDLAPRDVVACAIHREMEEHGYPYVFLDLASRMEAAEIRDRFPTIYEFCKRVGLDITAEPIPVVPAAHYFCGGVHVDSWGRTEIEGLYAVGEVSCTGVHGANRLASTSLLEGLVWGHRAGEDIADREDLDLANVDAVLPWVSNEERSPVEREQIMGEIQKLREIMWVHAGLERNAVGLMQAARDLKELERRVEKRYRDARLDDDLIALRNMVQTARLVVRAALQNPTSQGAHYRTDSKIRRFAGL